MKQRNISNIAIPILSLSAWTLIGCGPISYASEEPERPVLHVDSIEVLQLREATRSAKFDAICVESREGRFCAQEVEAFDPGPIPCPECLYNTPSYPPEYILGEPDIPPEEKCRRATNYVSVDWSGFIRVSFGQSLTLTAGDAIHVYVFTADDPDDSCRYDSWYEVFALDAHQNRTSICTAVSSTVCEIHPLTHQ